MNRASVLSSFVKTLATAALLSFAPLSPSLAEDTPASTPAKSFAFVDLQPHTNQKLTDPVHKFKGNDFAQLPTGEHTHIGVKFLIADGFVTLGGNIDAQKTKKIEGIRVEKNTTRLHFLHGTIRGYGQPGEKLFVPDDTLIAQYVVRYANKTTATIPIVYGQDVRDWWSWGNSPEVTRGRIAWIGTNEMSRAYNQPIHLYLTTWENPKPDLKILSIDYVSTASTAAAPFCIAITAEPK